MDRAELSVKIRTLIKPLFLAMVEHDLDCVSIRRNGGVAELDIEGSGVPPLPLSRTFIMEILEEELTERKWNRTTLARKSGLDAETIDSIFNGCPITDEIDAGLSKAFGTSEGFWVRMQNSQSG